MTTPALESALAKLRLSASHVVDDFDKGLAEITGKECAALLAKIEAADERISAAIEKAVRFGGIDGDHHKAWVIDQMVRELAGPDYERIVTEAKAGEDGPDTYEWNEGIAP
jgi:hypothetical protein